METRKRKPTDEARIRQLVENWAKALHAKDVEGVMSAYSPEVVWFDLAPPLVYKGAAIYRQSWEEWFATWDGPIGYDIRELTIDAGDDVAFCYSLNRISGKRTSGEETDVWVRATVCFRKIEGRWMVTHEHFSVPFYMDGSYRAAVDLTPQ